MEIERKIQIIEDALQDYNRCKGSIVLGNRMENDIEAVYQFLKKERKHRGLCLYLEDRVGVLDFKPLMIEIAKANGKHGPDQYWSDPPSEGYFEGDMDKLIGAVKNRIKYLKTYLKYLKNGTE